ncbi:hypothetical protein X471_00446 [Bartonella bacilliformis str. Heidi Mejia]|nr:hypothetical protein X471_00446 [Bartonella bacilliformis str. Heidi Mejia]KEG18775.1 hypothetical protein H707_00503 [Bartonella bacilliformis Hosp800-02]KEG23883.1 hypothetical protein H708_00510 [Bartonella bacilliformis VAB9028]KEG24232.1 hypothetical protein H706_00513 [Bartonella bacilliformis CAR600-02]
MALAFTGIGHSTDRAIVPGLLGEESSTVDLVHIDLMIKKLNVKKVQPEGHPFYHFDW